MKYGVLKRVVSTSTAQLTCVDWGRSGRRAALKEQSPAGRQSRETACEMRGMIVTAVVDMANGKGMGDWSTDVEDAESSQKTLQPHDRKALLTHVRSSSSTSLISPFAPQLRLQRMQRGYF